MKTSKLIASLAVTLVALSLSSCQIVADKASVEQVDIYPIVDINEYTIDGNAEIKFVEDNVSKIVVEGSKEETKETKITCSGHHATVEANSVHHTEMINGKISIGKKTKGLTVYIHSRNIKKINFSGNLVVSSETPLHCSNIEVKANGNCVITLHMSGSSSFLFEASDNNVADLTMDNVKYSNINMHGNCVIDVIYDKCHKSDVNIAGNCVAYFEGTIEKEFNPKSNSSSCVITNNVKKWNKD